MTAAVGSLGAAATVVWPRRVVWGGHSILQGGPAKVRPTYIFDGNI